MKKKIIALLMTAVLALSACSGKEEEVEETEIKVEATPTAAAPDGERERRKNNRAAVCSYTA